MKRTVLIALVFAFVASFAYAGDIKRPDSYNYQRALEAYQQGNNEEALDYLNKEVKENPKNGYAFMMIGSIRYSDEEYGRALSALNVALKHLPKKDKEYRSSAFITRALVNDALENDEAALQDYNQAVKADPDNTNGYYYRAEYLYSKEQYDLADADYKKLISMDNGMRVGYKGLGRSNIERGAYDDAIKQFDYVIRSYSDDSQAYAFRSECYFKKGDYDRAADDAVKSIDIDRNTKGFILLNEIADSALMPVTTRLKIKTVKEPNQSYWQYALGAVYEHTDNYAKAIEAYKKSYELDGHDITMERLSLCYESLGNYTMALNCIDEAIRIDSTEYSYIAQKADLLYDSGRTKEAIDTYTQYIQREPEYYGGYYRRGFMKSNIHDVDGAIEDYSTSITLDPTYFYAYLGRGDMYMLKGMKTDAYKDYRKVTELDTVPSQSSCAFYAYHELGEDDKAIAYLDSTMKKFPEDKGTFYDAACLYSRMGRYDEAVDYLRQSLQKGFRRFSHIERDDDLDPIRDRDDFKALIKEYKLRLTEDQQTEAEEDAHYEEVVSEVPFTRTAGVCDVKCEINGLPLHFVFDTGASTVSISNVEANFMFKNDYLKSSDIQGKDYYIDANGEIIAGTVVNLRKVHFGDIDLENVKASVVNNQKAPLLLGQSVFTKLGKFEIDNAKQVIRFTYKKKK